MTLSSTTEGSAMNNIIVTHLNCNGSVLGKPFVANLNEYKLSNAKTGFDWDQALTNFVNGRSYTTVNMPYGNIKLEMA